MKPLGNDWDTILKEDFSAPSYLALREFLKKEYSTRDVYPPMEKIFSITTEPPTQSDTLMPSIVRNGCAIERRR